MIEKLNDFSFENNEMCTDLIKYSVFTLPSYLGYDSIDNSLLYTGDWPED